MSRKGSQMNGRTTNRRAMLGVMTAIGLAVTGVASATSADTIGMDRVSTEAARTGAYSIEGGLWDPGTMNNSMAISPDEKTAVVAKSNSGTISRIDLTTPPGVNSRKEIAGFGTPRDLSFSWDGNVSVSDSSLGTIERITLSGTLLSRLPLGAGVFGTAATKDGKRIYANTSSSGVVTAVDLEASKPLKVYQGFTQPRQGVKLTHEEDALYVTDYGAEGKAITRINLSDGKQYALEGTWKEIRGITISEDGGRLFAATTATNQILVIDTNAPLGKPTVVDRIDIPYVDGSSETEESEPYGVELSPDGQTILTGNKGDDSISVIKKNSQGKYEITKRITHPKLKGPRQAINFSKDGRTAWVLTQDLTVAVIDMNTLTVKDIKG